MLNNDQNPSNKHQELLRKLCDLAMEWRGQKENRNSIAIDYARIYEELLLENWDHEIDIDCQLPEEYMPKEYLSRHPFIPSKRSWPLSWRHTSEEIEEILQKKNKKNNV